MQLFVAGFNAWNQLHFDSGQEGSQHVSEPDDIRAFASVLADEKIDKVEALLSYTRVWSTPSELRSAGVAPQGHEALRTTGYLDESKYLTAEASNGVVVVYIKATKCVTQYTSIQSLVTHNQKVQDTTQDRPSSPGGSPSWSHTFPNPITQLIAYETGFVALSSIGTVYTWGDERYSACLGRQVTDDSPVNQPNPIPDLESLPTGRITKIAAGSGTGTILAALTKGNDLYTWGQPPRSEPCRRSAPFSSSSVIQSPSSISHSSSSTSATTLSCKETETETETETSPSSEKSSNEGPILSSLNLTADPTPVDVADWKDIADIAIGERHLLALTTEGELFAIGDNSNGQLGLPGVKQATNVWTRVEIDDDRIKSGEAVMECVVAGPRNSVVIVRTKNIH